MKQFLLCVFISSIFLIACNSEDQQQVAEIPDTLNGQWELKGLSGGPLPFPLLYPGDKPVLTFNVQEGRITGSTSCNQLKSGFKADSISISFTEPAITKMYCEGPGEAVFLELLRQVNYYKLINKDELNLLKGNLSMLRFVRKK